MSCLLPDFNFSSAMGLVALDIHELLPNPCFQPEFSHFAKYSFLLSGTLGRSSFLCVLILDKQRTNPDFKLTQCHTIYFVLAYDHLKAAAL